MTTPTDLLHCAIEADLAFETATDTVPIDDLKALYREAKATAGELTKALVAAVPFELIKDG